MSDSELYGFTDADWEFRADAEDMEIHDLRLREEAGFHMDSLRDGAQPTRYATVFAQNESEARSILVKGRATPAPGQVIFTEPAREFFKDHGGVIPYYHWQHTPTRHQFLRWKWSESKIGPLSIPWYRRERGWYECLYDSELGHLNRPFMTMFEAEVWGWLNPRRAMANPLRPPIERMRPDVRNDVFGIALSGGGMRSATFSLGVVQSLVPSGLLHQADYISSVSGGGYFGVSLAGLCAEDGLPYKNLPRMSTAVAGFPFGIESVAPPAVAVGPQSFRLPIHGSETPALWHVRKFSKLLGDRIGFLDVVSWVTVGRFLVSTALIWGVLVAVLAVLAMMIAASGGLLADPGWVRDRFRDLPGNPQFPVGSWGELGKALPWALAPAAAILVALGVPALFGFRPLENWMHKVIHAVTALSLVILLSALIGAGVWAISPEDPSDEGTRPASQESVDDDDTNLRADQGPVLFGIAGPAGLALAWGLKQLRGDPANKKLVTRIAARVLTITGGYVLLFVVAVLITGHYSPEASWSAFFHHIRNPELPVRWELGPHRPDFSKLEWNLGRWDYTLPMVLTALCLFPWFGLGPGLMNRLSPHSMYADRLQKTWIISAKKDKEATAPTARITRNWRNVWPAEWLKVRTLRTGAYVKTNPYPLICTTLSAPGSKGDKYPDRATEPFVIAPIFSGSALTQWKRTEELEQIDNLRLAEAAATSGAAIASNASVKGDRNLSIILTLLNARLGRWMKNPRQARRRLPIRALNRLPIVYFLKELFGGASRDDAYVYLSDGGHFENLGLYELVRRRCRFIIAVAADEEPKGKPDKLGNLAGAVRLCRIDFGAEVEIGNFAPLVRNKETGEVLSFFAAGRIRYPVPAGVTEASRDANSGYLIIVKSGIVGSRISPDLLEHWRANPEFPYKSITDEQYDFTQFESYRQLGYLAGSRVVANLGSVSSLQSKFQSVLRSYQQGTY